MAEVGLSANPIGAHQVNHHRIDREAVQNVVVLVRIKGVPWSMYGAPIEYCGTPMTKIRRDGTGAQRLQSTVSKPSKLGCP